MLTNEDLNVAIVRLQERTETMAADIHEIKEALVGTGVRPGLVERITIQEQRSAAHGSRLDLLERRPHGGTSLSTGKLIGVIVSLSGAVAGLVELLAKHS